MAAGLSLCHYQVIKRGLNFFAHIFTIEMIPGIGLPEIDDKNICPALPQQ